MSNAADLIAAIEAADATSCVQLLSDRDEKLRRAVYPEVALRTEALEEELRDVTRASRKKAFEQYLVARVALLGVATFVELKKLRSWSFSNWHDAAAAMFANRRPSWLAEWVEFELTRNFRNWPTARALVRCAAIPRPATEFYVLGMIAAPNVRLTPRQLLEEDPGLLGDELWRLFECEGTGELSLAAYDKYVNASRSWFDAFLSLSADGTIDRSRVLSATLEALQRDFAPFRAGWFSRLHEALKPSGRERVQFSPRYLDLVGSQVPATVSFAVKALVRAHDAGATDIKLERLAPALEARAKGTVELALALAAKLSRNSVADASCVSSVVARALAHESRDVQTAALKLVGNDIALVAPYLDLLAPSVRAHWGGNEPVLSSTETAGPIAGQAMYVMPIRTLNELVETFAAVLENQGPPIEIERVIDGLARVGIPAAAGDANFQRLTAGLANRAEALLGRRATVQPRAALATLALAWIRRVRPARPEAEKSLADFLIWRLWSASEQAASRIEQPLVSLPTFPDGRIDGHEFDARLAKLTNGQRKAAENDRESLFHLDLLLGVLRTRGGAVPEKIQLIWKKKSWEASGRTYSYHYPLLEVHELPNPSRFDPAGLTTAHFSSTLEMKRWCATVNPRWPEGWFAAGCRDLGGNLERWHADWSTRAYLEPLVDSSTHLGDMGALLIALGIGASEAGQRGLATDALLSAISGGRLGPAAFGRALSEAAASGAIKFGRWSKELYAVAQAGTAAAEAIFRAIEVLFESGCGRENSDFGRIVELEYELAHLTRLKLRSPGCLRTLAGLKVAGRTGRAASELVNRSSAPD